MKVDLKKLSDEELWILFPIILKPHNPQYKYWYQDEVNLLEEILGADEIKRISHIGSTSVHDLLAKPTIDILLEVKSEAILDRFNVILEKSGYICLKQEDGFKHQSLLCLKGYLETGFDEKVYHLHIRVINNHKELYFRDYLRDHPHVAREYGDLKIELMEKYKHHRDNYTEHKSEFINRYTEKAMDIYPDRYKEYKKQ